MPVGCGGWLCEYITASPGKIASGGISLSLSSIHLFLYSRRLHSTSPPTTLRWRAFALPFIGISNHRGIPSTYQRCSSARRRAREYHRLVKVARSFLSIPSCFERSILSILLSSPFFFFFFFFRIVWFFFLGLWKIVCWWKFRWGAIEVDGSDTDRGSIRPPSRVKGRSVIMYTSQTSG